MITVIGKLRDIELYRGRAGYNIMPLSADWSPEANRAWIDAALQRGDQLLLASWEVTGEYRNELIYILKRITEKNGGADNNDK